MIWTKDWGLNIMWIKWRLGLRMREEFEPGKLLWLRLIYIRKIKIEKKYDIIKVQLITWSLSYIYMVKVGENRRTPAQVTPENLRDMCPHEEPGYN